MTQEEFSKLSPEEQQQVRASMAKIRAEIAKREEESKILFAMTWELTKQFVSDEGLPEPGSSMDNLFASCLDFSTRFLEYMKQHKKQAGEDESQSERKEG